jgi:hypothetical protein
MITNYVDKFKEMQGKISTIPYYFGVEWQNPLVWLAM